MSDLIQCAKCSWSAVMRGGTSEERLEFLKRQLDAHAKEKHPDAPIGYRVEKTHG